MILNHFLLLLRHNQLAVKHFLQDNRPLFTALVTSETPGVSSFTSDASAGDGESGRCMARLHHNRTVIGMIIKNSCYPR